VASIHRGRERDVEIHRGGLEKLIAGVFLVVLPFNNAIPVQITACEERNDGHPGAVTDLISKLSESSKSSESERFDLKKFLRF
jgi:hypothetical protein